MLQLIYIFLGGGIGASLRYVISNLSKKYFTLPIYGTFIVNIFGCLLIGYIFGLTVNKAYIFSPALKLFITVGLLGGLTTFSTLNLEIFELIKTGKILQGLIYLIFSIIFGLLSTYVGYLLSNLHH